MSKKTFEVRIAPDECKGCERCVIACPRSVLKMGVQLKQTRSPVRDSDGAGVHRLRRLFSDLPRAGAITVVQIESAEA